MTKLVLPPDLASSSLQQQTKKSAVFILHNKAGHLPQGTCTKTDKLTVFMSSYIYTTSNLLLPQPSRGRSSETACRH